MKIDQFTKVLIAIIAVNLTYQTVKDIRFGTNSFAAENNYEIPDIKYGIVPLNADGSISVKLSDYDRLDVNIVDISTSDLINVNLKDISTSDLLNINLKDINTPDELNVNIDGIGGWNVYDKLPVEIKN